MKNAMIGTPPAKSIAQERPKIVQKQPKKPPVKKPKKGV